MDIGNLFALSIPVLLLLVAIYARIKVNIGQDRLGSYGQSFLRHLSAEYGLIPPEDVPPDLEGKIRALLERKDPPLTWGELLGLELYLLRCYREEKLLRKAWLIRTRYEAVAGASWERYLESKPPALEAAGPDAKAPLTVSADLLRADLEVVLQETYWLYRIRSAWEEKRSAIAQRVSDALIIIAIFLGLGAGFQTLCQPLAHEYHGLQLLLEIGLIGASGGLVNLLRRSQGLTNPTERLKHLLEAEYGGQVIWVQSSVSGAVFSLALMLIFMSGLLRGDTFPDLSAVTGGFLERLREIPSDGGLVAKLLLWSFVAGFAEQFVPDFLDRLAASTES